MMTAIVQSPQHPKISSYEALRLRVTYLNTLKEAQEEVLKEDFKQVLHSMQPANLVKNAIENMSQDKDLKNSAGNLGVNMGLDFLIGKMFNKNGSIGGYIKTAVAEQVLGFVMNKYGDKIEDVTSSLKDKVFSFFKKTVNHQTEAESH